MENNYQQNQGYFYSPPQNVYQAPANYYPPQYTQPKKSYLPLSKTDKSLIITMLISGFLFFDFAVFKGFNLGFTLFYFIFFIATTLYLRPKKPTLFSVCTGVLSLAASVTFIFDTNNLVKFFTFVLIVLLYALYSIDLSETYNFKKGSFKALIDLVLSYFAYPFINLPSFFGSLKESSKKNKKLIAVLIGIAVSLPALMVIVPLLISGDAAFEGLITSIFKNIRLVLFEIVLAVVFAPYLITMLYGKKHKLNVRAGKVKEYNGSISKTIGITFLSVISFTYLVYLFSQLAYFFSAFEGFLPEDYEKTASAFARRGFYEMFAVCVINVLLVSIVSFVTKKSEAKKLSGGIKGLSCFVSIFSVVLVVTALAKMKLNVETYGYTANRLLVTAFIIMVLFAILFFIAHIFVPSFNYFQPLVVICSVIFVALAFLNVDAFVANYNVTAYQIGALDSVDVDNIDTDAGIPYLIELIDDENEKISKHAANVIVNKFSWYDYDEIIKPEREGDFESAGEYSFAKSFDFRSYNVTRSEAYSALIAYANSLDKNERHALYEKGESYWDYGWEDDYDYSYEENEAVEEAESQFGEDVFEENIIESYSNFDTNDDVKVSFMSADVSGDDMADVLTAIKEKADKELPLPVFLQRALYSYTEVNGNALESHQSLIAQFEDEFVLPEIENGRYFFADKSDGTFSTQDRPDDYVPTSFIFFMLDEDTQTVYLLVYEESTNS